jgi:apolipoprotein D and lipocalin family protein
VRAVARRQHSPALHAGRAGTLLLIAIALLLVLTGCAGTPDNVSPVRGFDVERYLGRWYEIARLDHSFERGLERVTADYGLRDDGGLRVVNRGYDSDRQRWKEAEGKAYFTGARDVGSLKVSFFGPFYGGYNIIELDKKDYDHALVAGPNRSYLWILARQPHLDPSIKQGLVAKAAALGFDTDALIYVDHPASAVSQSD